MYGYFHRIVLTVVNSTITQNNPIYYSNHKMGLVCMWNMNITSTRLIHINKLHRKLSWTKRGYIICTTILYFILSFQWQRSKYNNKYHKVTNGVSLLYIEFFIINICYYILINQVPGKQISIYKIPKYIKKYPCIPLPTINSVIGKPAWKSIVNIIIKLNKNVASVH